MNIAISREKTKRTVSSKRPFGRKFVGASTNVQVILNDEISSPPHPGCVNQTDVHLMHIGNKYQLPPSRPFALLPSSPPFRHSARQINPENVPSMGFSSQPISLSPRSIVQDSFSGRKTRAVNSGVLRKSSEYDHEELAHGSSAILASAMVACTNDCVNAADAAINAARLALNVGTHAVPDQTISCPTDVHLLRGGANLQAIAEGRFPGTRGDHLSTRYEVLGYLGRGVFGDVFKCRDHRTGLDLAIKVARQISPFNEQSQHEASLLRLIREKACKGQHMAPNECKKYHFLELIDDFLLDNSAHHCLVFPLYGTNLFEHLRVLGFAPFPTRLVLTIARQLCQALKFLNECDVLHGDIKPENILFTSVRCTDVVLIDFGCSISVAGEPTLPSYIQSRFYRAPEVMWGHSYGKEVDMWSLGCVLYELCTGSALFPGTTTSDQMVRIVEVLGLSPYLEPEVSANAAQEATHRLPGSKPLRSLFKKSKDSEEFIKLILPLLENCLTWDPSKRLTPSAALKTYFPQHEK